MRTCSPYTRLSVYPQYKGRMPDQIGRFMNNHSLEKNKKGTRWEKRAMQEREREEESERVQFTAHQDGLYFYFCLLSWSKHTLNKRRQMLMRPTSLTMLFLLCCLERSKISSEIWIIKFFKYYSILFKNRDTSQEHFNITMKLIVFPINQYDFIGLSEMLFLRCNYECFLTDVRKI